MYLFYLILIFLLLTGHLFCELLTIFIRYNYAALSKHMAGAVVANYFAIASRGFVSLYAIVVAFSIEKLNLELGAYCVCVSCSLLLSGLVSVFLSKSILIIDDGKLSFSVRDGAILDGNSIDQDPIPKIGIFIIIILGVQFIAMSLAYALCMVFVEDRLIIISIAPALSMLGTVAAAVCIEPKFAKFVDAIPKYGFDVSSKYLYARGVSLFISALSFMSLLLLDF